MTAACDWMVQNVGTKTKQLEILENSKNEVLSGIHGWLWLGGMNNNDI